MLKCDLTKRIDTSEREISVGDTVSGIVVMVLVVDHADVFVFLLFFLWFFCWFCCFFFVLFFFFSCRRDQSLVLACALCDVISGARHLLSVFVVFVFVLHGNE